MFVRPFGQTGLHVSALGFGAGHVGDPSQDETEVGRLLNEALALGVTVFDTARSYGLSEERIGRHLAHRRQEFVLISKCGYGVEHHEDWTPACISAGVDDALRRMRTDYVDAMLFHSCPRHVLTQDDLLTTLERAVTQGKVRVAGYSGENEDLIFAVGCGRFKAIECSVNLFDQRAIDGAVAQAAEAGTGIIAKRPLGNTPWRFSKRPTGQYAEVYWDRMRIMSLELGPMSWDEAALRFAAFQPGVSTAIAGTSRVENLRRNVEFVRRGPLTEEMVAAFRQAFHANDRDWVGQV